jgi:hypothetical protein
LAAKASPTASHGPTPLRSCGKLETGNAGQICDAAVYAALASLCYRLIPLLMPRGDDDKHVAFYFREHPEPEVAENYVHVSDKAICTEDTLDGSVDSFNFEVYDKVLSRIPILPNEPEALELLSLWRQLVQDGWHGYLGTDVEGGCSGS